MGLFWELYQQSRIHRAEDAATEAGVRATRRAADVGDRVNAIQEDMDRLMLVVAGLMQILSERLDISDEQIEAAVRDIDLRDGKLDGRQTLSPRTCPSCGRPNGFRHKRCLYCGDELPDRSIIDSR